MIFDYVKGSPLRRARRNLFLWVLIVALFCGLNICSAFAETVLPENPMSAKKVLILYSYFASTPAYVAITSPMLSTLIGAGVLPDNLHPEYLDLGRHEDQEYRKSLQEFLQNKYSRGKIDLIITLHGAAQQFVLGECKNLWPQVQLLSLLAPGVPMPGRIGRESGVVLLKLDFRGTLERALEMFPQTKRVLFVTGSGPPELKYIEQAKVAFEPWQGKVAFEYTVGQSLDEILKRVANLPPGTIVLASALITDGRGANFVVAEATKSVAKAANAPVFGFYDSVFGTGLVGGSMEIFDNTGTDAGKFAVAILSGKIPLSDPPLILPSLPPVPMFDWTQIERWRGDATRLPENSIFLHRPPTLWGQYKTAVISTIVILIILTGLLLGLLMQLRHRKQAEEALSESEYRWKFALEGARDGVWDWNLTNGAVYYSNRWKALLGYYSEDEIGNEIDNWEKRIHPDDKEQTLATMQAHFDGVKPFYNSEHRLLCKDGSYKWILSRGIALSRGEDGKPLRMIGTLSDITERKQMEDQIRQQAFYDTLTNLPNRRLFSDRLSQFMVASKRTGCYGAVMFLDLDNFKSLNDQHGHQVGDLLLIEVADRLKSCVREMDTVGRFGGDEFVVMLGELNASKDLSTAQASIVAEKIGSTLAKPYRLTIRRDDKTDTTVEHHCTASIGVALFIDQEAGQEDILKWADAAMYEAKEAGCNLVRFHTS